MDRGYTAKRQAEIERQQEGAKKKKRIWCGREKNGFVTPRLFPVICRSEQHRCTTASIQTVMVYVSQVCQMEISLACI